MQSIIPASKLQQLKAGLPIIEIERAVAGLDTTVTLIGYLPVHLDGKLLAIVELDIDATEAANAIRITFSELSLAVALGAAVVATLLILLLLVRRSELRRAQTTFARLKELDRLTNVYNRGGLLQHIGSAIDGAVSCDEKVVVACVDIDRFKSINEQLGLAAGDRLLRDFADRIRANMRDKDSLARLGNDAFGIVIGGVDAKANIPAILQRIRNALSQPFELNSHRISLSVCIGISVAPDHAGDAGTLMKHAETALHNAKVAGRGTITVYADNMTDNAAGGLLLENDLRQAIENDEIEVLYQPQIDLNTRKVVGCEALVRWNHPQRGMISPSRFIPIAEDSGLIHALSARVLYRACSEATQWPAPISVAVNLSPAQLVSGTVPGHVTDVLMATGLPAERLELEVTEGMVMKKSDTTLHALRDLRDIGVGIAIDDFGTGYSSLGYLAHFPFTKLKIDRAFVVSSGQFKNMTAIIKAIVSLGKALNVTVIVEGVETRGQLERMQRAGCQLVQGYYFSKPLKHEELIEFIQQQAAQPIKLRG